MGSEDEGDGVLITAVEVGDAGSLVFIARDVTPPKTSRPRVDDKPSVLLFYRDLNRERGLIRDSSLVGTEVLEVRRVRNDLPFPVTGPCHS